MLELNETLYFLIVYWLVKEVQVRMPLRFVIAILGIVRTYCDIYGMNIVKRKLTLLKEINVVVVVDS
jgi:hypothetical protein